VLPNPIPIRRPTGDAPAPSPDAPSPDGITKPRQVGGSARFLTDVIVELGLVDHERVTIASDEARQLGRMPEDVLLDLGVLTSDGLARAVAERHGLDHLDLATFQPDAQAASLISYEVLTVSDEIRKLALERAAATEMQEVAVRQGMRLLRDDGLEKVRLGLTSIAEVTRVAGTGESPVEI